MKTDMKKHLILLAASTVTLLSLLTACMSSLPETDPVDIKFTYGAYFLNAGNDGKRDAELTQLNTLYSIVNQNVFRAVNNKEMGDGGRDIIVLGNHMYVTLNGSRRISVIDPSSCKETGSIVLEADGTTLSPRSLASFEGALIVGLDEGYVARVDTATLKITALQEVSGQPGAIAIANQKLYVANYRVNGAPGATVQMLNPVDLHVMKTVDVQPGPRYLVADPVNNSLMLISEGNGASVFQVIDTDTENVITIDSVVKPALMAAGPDQAMVLYVQDTDDELGGRFLVFNTQPDSRKVEGGFIRDGSYVRNPSALFIDQTTGNVYIAEQMKGSEYAIIYVYTSYGQYITSFNTGAANPCAAVFLAGNTVSGK